MVKKKETESSGDPSNKKGNSKKTIFGIDALQFALRCVLILVPIIIILLIISLIVLF